VKDTAENLISALGDDMNAAVSSALKHIVTTLELFNNNQIECNGSTKDNLLTEFLQATKDIARITQGLKQSTTVSCNKHGQVSREAASIVENLINASASANKSDGSSLNMTLEGSKIIKCIEQIIQVPDDLQRLANNVNTINVATSKLIANARDKARAEEDKSKKPKLPTVHKIWSKLHNHSVLLPEV